MGDDEIVEINVGCESSNNYISLLSWQQKEKSSTEGTKFKNHNGFIASLIFCSAITPLAISGHIVFVSGS